MSPNELLPCPFCGECAVWHAGSDNENWAGATCKFCGVTLDEQDGGCMDRAAEKWNRRIESAQAVAPGGYRKIGTITGTYSPGYSMALLPIADAPIGTDLYAAAPASEVVGRRDDDKGFNLRIGQYANDEQHADDKPAASSAVGECPGDFCCLATKTGIFCADGECAKASDASDHVQRAVDDATANGQDPYLAGITAKAEQEQAGELCGWPDGDDSESLALACEGIYEAACAYDTFDQLPKAAALLRRAARVEVDEAMVERALRASYESNWNNDSEAMRAALTAALEPQK